MSNINTITKSDMTADMITIDELCRLSGLTKLTVQKKLRTANIQPVAMLKTGNVGRPSRIFSRENVNGIFNIPGSASTLAQETPSNKDVQGNLSPEQGVSLNI